jgi:hypothetical protein
MHGSLTVVEQVLMGAPERYEEPRGFSLLLQIEDTTEAERMGFESLVYATSTAWESCLTRISIATKPRVRDRPKLEDGRDR